MRVAEVLSDLTSLQVCEPTAALALVGARPKQLNETDSSGKTTEASDPDLQRADDLLKLHAIFKTSQAGGMEGLSDARDSVANAVQQT